MKPSRIEQHVRRSANQLAVSLIFAEAWAAGAPSGTDDVARREALAAAIEAWVLAERAYLGSTRSTGIQHVNARFDALRASFSLGGPGAAYAVIGWPP